MAAAREIAFIDSAVSDLPALLAGLRPGIVPVLLEEAEPAPTQIARAMRGHSGIELVHIIAHGSEGAVRFAGGTLCLDNVDAYAGDFADIGEALGEEGAMHLWSCRSGRGSQGAAFVDALASASGAHVSAATHVVGSAHLGGDWRLDVGSDACSERVPLTSAGIAHYAGVLAAITGTPGNDIILDTSVSDTIDALGGDDTVTVTGGADAVVAGTGIDRLIVNYGSVTGDIAGFPTAGSLAGGYNGYLTRDTGTSVVYAGVELFSITTGSGNDSVGLGDGDDVANTGAGNDTIDAGAGGLTADGGAGVDGLAANLSGATGNITLNLQTNSSSGPGTFSVVNIEYLRDFGGGLYFRSGSGNDTIVTGTLTLGDALDTGGGNDTITVASGTDDVTAGSGTDRLIVNYGSATGDITGFPTSGSFASGYSGYFTNDIDTSVAYTGVELFSITTGGGNDAISLGDGDDVANTGAGNDTLTAGEGIDVLTGGGGGDLLDGGGGFDYVTYLTASAGVLVDLQSPGLNTGDAAGDTYVSVEGFFGSLFNDFLYGTANADVFNGQGGDDRIEGRAGSDTIWAGAGHDTIVGGLGADSMFGETGNDIYVVDDPADVVTENANEGIDQVQSSTSYTLSVNVEELLLTGTGGTEATGNTLNNVLTGNAGSNILDGRGGADTLDGSAGFDFAMYYHAPAAVTVDLVAPALNTGHALGDTYISVEGFLGSLFADFLYGGFQPEALAGLDGDDRIEGRAGNDFLLGGSGNDVLDGGTGADSMLGEGGDDTYTVDDVGDTVTENANGGFDTVSSTVTFTVGPNVENLSLAGSGAINGTGNDGNNIINGNGGNNVLDGGAGADTLNGGAGYDYAAYTTGGSVTVDLQNSALYGGAAAGDTLSSIEGVVGSVMDDSIYGAGNGEALAGLAGNDTLHGRDGNDILLGGNGNDVLVGGMGADQMSGEAGADRFDWNASGEGGDTINGFTRGAGADVLDIRDVLTGYAPGSSNPSNFVQFVESAGNTTFSVNADGIGGDFTTMAVLQGITGLQLSDMIAQGNLLLSL